MSRTTARHLVSLFTDASWYQSTGRGGWAYWAKCDLYGARWGSGAFRRLLVSSNEAEVCAVANALHALVLSGTVHAGSHVLVQTDCEHAARLLRGRLTVVPRREAEARDHVEMLSDRCGFSYSTRHVKGHVRRGMPRHWANNMCDRMARQACRDGSGKEAG